jgi:hypothetical protein
MAPHIIKPATDSNKNLVMGPRRMSDAKTDWPTSDFSQLRVAEAGSWSRGQFREPKDGERPPLEAATKQSSDDRDWEH